MIFFENLENAIEKTRKQEKEELIENETNIEDSNITKEEWELAHKLNAIEEFTIDRFEEDIAILENRETGEMLEIVKNQLPDKIQEGDILKRIRGKYVKNQEKTQETAERIEKKMKDLWQ